jgi:hypothetical protein
LAEIQKIEEEREREAKLRREMQEAAQARARQEEEAQRRQQVCQFLVSTLFSSALFFCAFGLFVLLFSNFELAKTSLR